MKFNFRKIASVLTSTIMLSSTIALAAAANFPSPYVQNGNSNVAIVYGSTAAPTDFAAVLDINSFLTGQLASQTATSTTTSGGATTSGGDSVNLATASQLIYMNSSITAARSALTNLQMPNILANGIAADGSGNQYSYTQTIYPGNVQVTFSRNGQAINPAPMVTFGTSGQTNPLLNYTLTFNKPINITDSSVNNVVGQAQVTILGQNYIIGSGNTQTDLYLYGSGSELIVNEGASTNFTFNNVTHSLMFQGASSTTQGTIVVDGQTKNVIQGSSYTYAGGYNIFVKNVYYSSKTGTLSNIDVLVGANLCT